MNSFQALALPARGKLRTEVGLALVATAVSLSPFWATSAVASVHPFATTYSSIETPLFTSNVCRAMSAINFKIRSASFRAKIPRQTFIRAVSPRPLVINGVIVLFSSSLMQGLAVRNNRSIVGFPSGRQCFSEIVHRPENVRGAVRRHTRSQTQLEPLL